MGSIQKLLQKWPIGRSFHKWRVTNIGKSQETFGTEDFFLGQAKSYAPRRKARLFHDKCASSYLNCTLYFFTYVLKRETAPIPFVDVFIFSLVFQGIYTSWCCNSMYFFLFFLLVTVVFDGHFFKKLKNLISVTAVAVQTFTFMLFRFVFVFFLCFFYLPISLCFKSTAEKYIKLRSTSAARWIFISQSIM